MQATGKHASAVLGCSAKAAGKGAAVDAACLAKARAGFEAAFAKAEGKGGCTATGDAAGVEADVAGAVAAIADALGSPGPSACAKLKRQAAGKRAAAKYGCVATANKKEPARGVAPGCVQKADAKHAQAFAKAEAKGDCLAPLGDEPAIAKLVDDLLAGTRRTVAPPLSTCAPLVPTELHGDDFLPGQRLARIVKGKVPCVHSEDFTATRCAFSTTPGAASGSWVETPSGPFARVGQLIGKDGAVLGEYVVAADVASGPASCLDATGMDTAGRVADGTELARVCAVEDLGASYNALWSDDFYGSFLGNWTDAVVCSADQHHPDLYPEYLGHGDFDADVHCWTGQGAALNDPNGYERDWLGFYFSGENARCHYIRNAGYEVPGAKRPAVKTLPAPGIVNVRTKIVWRPVTHINIANYATPFPTPSRTRTPTPTATPDRTATPEPTPTTTPEPDFVVDTTDDVPALLDCDPETAADCSLRGALAKAAARGAPTRIGIPAGAYGLTATGDCLHDTGQFGPHTVYNTTSLCLRGAVTLAGAGAADTIIDGNGTARVLLVGNAGPTRVEGVTLRNGSQTGGSLFGGGGAVNNGGDLTLADCVVRDSSAQATGGGVYSSGALAIERCTITGNTAGTGGGIYSDSFNVPVDATIVDSTITYNHATVEHGGGIMLYGGNAGGTTTIRGTTIAGNDSKVAGGGVALAGLDGTVSLTNSTVSGNRCFWYSGGGLSDLGRWTIALRNVTVTDNRSEDAGGTNGAAGGVSLDGTSTLTIANTIIAGNTAPAFAPDCYASTATVLSAGYNLVGDPGDDGNGGTYCDLGGTGDVFGIDPLLGPLADNGGPIATHLPLGGSPAIDGGDPAGCADENDVALTIDQRGALRPTDGDDDGDARCDVGAVEAP